MSTVQSRPIVIHEPPPREAGAITAERYISRGWLAREFEAVWQKAWLFACREWSILCPKITRTFDRSVNGHERWQVFTGRKLSTSHTAIHGIINHRRR